MSDKIKNRHYLKVKEIKNLQNELRSTFNSVTFDKKTSFESGEYEGIKLFFLDNIPCFMIYKNKILFTIHGLNRYTPKEKYVVVDMGAVKFVTNGADVMAPGIVDADTNIAENDQVWICDVNNKKPLAVGIAIISGDQMVAENSGKAIITIHHVGDMLWSFGVKSL